MKTGNWQQVGTHDLRIDTTPQGGFHHVVLKDADDGDVIVINEDDLIPLRDKLSEIISNLGRQLK
jgi:hypothetical protein